MRLVPTPHIVSPASILLPFSTTSGDGLMGAGRPGFADARTSRLPRWTTSWSGCPLGFRWPRCPSRPSCADGSLRCPRRRRSGDARHEYFWSEFAGHRLGHRAKPEFCRGECRKPTPPRTLAVAPVKRIVPRPRGSHVARRLTADQKSAIAGKFPCLEEQLSVVSSSGLLTFDPALNRQTSIGPISFSTSCEHCLDFGFLTGIDAERVEPRALGLQFIDKRLRFGRVARQMQTS